MAKVAFAEGRSSQAEVSLRKALANWLVTIGTQHPMYASGLASLAVSIAKRQPEEAARLFREAIDAMDAAYGGEDSSNLGYALVVYGHHLAHMKRK